MKNPSSSRSHVVTVSIVAGIASLFALAAPGCGSTTCTTSDECSDAEYCPQEEGACLGPSLPERSCVDRPTECPDVPEPVCGCDAKTYTNACIAAVAGVAVAAQGACTTTCADCGSEEFCSSELGACGQGTECLPRPESCPPITDPVCGCDSVTYPSECEAQRAGTSVFAEDTCEIPIEETECGGPTLADCPEGYRCELETTACLDDEPLGLCRLIPSPEDCVGINNPVCGCDGQTYASPCAAALADIDVEEDAPCACGPGRSICPEGTYCAFTTGACSDARPIGQCATVPEECPPVDTPVCGCDGVTYPNACQASAAGTSVFIQRPCPCGPTTGSCPDGQFCNFPTGVCGDPDPVGECSVVPNDCPDVIVPVCGCDGEDYDSACEAAREGLSIRVVGPCDPTAAPAGAGPGGGG